MKGSHYNRVIGESRKNCVGMLGGYREIHLTTFRTMKIYRSVLEGKDWRAICRRCEGKGNLEGVGWAVEDRYSDGGKKCFACDGDTKFNLPSLQSTGQLIGVWMLDRVTRGRLIEIKRVAMSETDYLKGLAENADVDVDDHAYELNFLKTWEWAFRRYFIAENGGEFFTSNDPRMNTLKALYAKQVDLRLRKKSGKKVLVPDELMEEPELMDMAERGFTAQGLLDELTRRLSENQ